MSETYKQKNMEMEAQLAVMAAENEALRDCLSEWAKGPAGEYLEAPWASVALQYMRENEALKDRVARMQAGHADGLAGRDVAIARLDRQLSEHERCRDQLEARHLEDLDTIRDLRAQLEKARAKAEEMAFRYDRLDATLGKVQDERDAAEAKARQAQEAMEGAIKDTTYWRHQYEAAVKRAQALQGRLDEKEVADSGTARHRKPRALTPMEQQAFCEIKKLGWQLAEKDRENQRLRARLDQLGAG